MATQNFVDHVKICCRSGKGGAGSVHFHRDKRNPKGGPDGGDGGRGGHIILRGNRNVWTLLALKYRKHVIATAGENGRASHSSVKMERISFWKCLWGQLPEMRKPVRSNLKSLRTGKKRSS